MENILEKISSYNLFNNLLPGAVYCFLLNEYMDRNFFSGNIIENLFIYYFAGMIISRIGSIIVEPFCKKMKFIEFADYGEFRKASEKDSEINILSETNNTYRSMLSLTIVFFVSMVYIYISSKCDLIDSCTPYIMMIVLFLIFAFSYRKQTSYVRKRVTKTNEEEQG